MRSQKQLENKIIEVFEEITSNKNSTHMALMLGESNGFSFLEERVGELQRLLMLRRALVEAKEILMEDEE